MKTITGILLLLFLAANVLQAQNKVVETDSKTKKYGIKDKLTKKWIAMPVYDHLLEVSSLVNGQDITECFIATKNKKQFLVSKNGINIVSPQFDFVRSLVCNKKLFIVKSKDTYSLFELDKGILKEFGSFNEYENFDSNGKLFKIRKNKSWYLLFAETKKIDTIPYDVLDENVIWKDSLFYIYAKKTKWGIINNSGVNVIPFDFDTITNSTEFYRDYIKAEKNKKWGLFDLSGKTLLENNFDNIELNTHQAFRMVFNEHFIIGMREQNFLSVKKDGKWGVVDFKNQGRPIIPFIYDSICGVNLQKKIFLVVKDGKMGGIDFYNNVIYPFTFNGIERIDANFTHETNDKLFLVNNGCTSCMPGFMFGGKFGITDSVGKIILEPNANVIKLFNKQSQYNDQGDDSTFLGYIWNLDGELKETNIGGDTINAQDPNTGEDILAVATIFSYNFKGGKSGIVNCHGKYILPAQFDDFIFAFIKMDSYTGESSGLTLNKISQPSRQTEFTYHIDTAIDIIAIKDLPAGRQGKKYGVYSWQGKEIIPCIFDSISHENFSLDVSDSVFNARKYVKQFFKVYLNNYLGFYTRDGKKLIDPVIREILQQFECTKLDSSLIKENYSANWNDLFFTQIICKNETNKKILLYSMAQYGEEWLGYENVVNTEEISMIEKGEFALMDKGRLKLLSNEWYDDLILIDAYFGFHKYTELRTQLLLYTRNSIDSVVDKSSKIKLCDRIMPSGMLQENRYFLDYYFAKKQGKWFVTSIYNSLIPSNAFGFDSVWVAEKNTFQGFLNGKFSYYSLTDKNFQAPEIELEFPAETYNSHIICKNCNYNFIQYSKTDTLTRMTEYGDELPDEIVTYTVKIPLVKKGLFNIVNEKKDILLKNWADEIRIPVSEPGQNFSITDSSSTVYNPKFYQFNDGWPFYNEYQKSIALKYGSVWRLTSIQNQEYFIDGFEDIKSNGEYWEAKKEGKTFLYTIDGLKLKE